jgi:hypothetical protein
MDAAPGSRATPRWGSILPPMLRGIPARIAMLADPVLNRAKRPGGMKNFSQLTEPELLALAIALEEEDSRIYEEFAHGLAENYPDTARMFSAMSEEESGHRHRLLDLSTAPSSASTSR